MNQKRDGRFWMYTALFLALCLAIIAREPSLVSARESFDDAFMNELKVFTDVLSIVQKDYVKEVDNNQLIQGAIKGMITALDPHSGYLEPDYFTDLQAQTKGEFGGLGIEITIRDGLLVVVSPMEGSPAERSGLKSGDVIVKVNNEYIKEISLIDVVKKLRGPKGSHVDIAFIREGEKDLREVRIIRDKIQIKSVRSLPLNGNIGYIRVSQFMETTNDDIESHLAEIRKQAGGIKALILDFRNNPGGLLTQAVKVSDLFLKDGVIVYTDGRGGTQKQKFYAHSAKTEPDYPMAVLVNGGSASASEIVAGALKDHGRAVLIGTQTFGKGSVQTINPLPNGGALQLTTALYYTKSGRSFQAEGITPDIEIEDREPEDEEELISHKRSKRILREKDLPRAFTNPISKQKNNDKKDAEGDVPIVTKIKPKDFAKLVKTDPVVLKAIEVLQKDDVNKNY
jgi:carboxyl-terminal processing protease